MPVELLLGITVLSEGGTTIVPERVREMLKLKPTTDRKEKILWTLEGDEIVVSKGTPQSSFRKTVLRRGGRAAVPKHIIEALKLKSTPQNQERLLWLEKDDKIVVRKGATWSIPTD